MKDKLREMGVEMASPAFLTMERHLSSGCRDICPPTTWHICPPTAQHFCPQNILYICNINCWFKLTTAFSSQKLNKRSHIWCQYFAMPLYCWIYEKSNLCLALYVDLRVGFPPDQHKIFVNLRRRKSKLFVCFKVLNLT